MAICGQENLVRNLSHSTKLLQLMGCKLKRIRFYIFFVSTQSLDSENQISLVICSVYWTKDQFQLLRQVAEGL